MTRGEVWWYELPDVGRRPGCILTRPAAIPVLNALVVAPASRTIRGIPNEVRLGRGDGMPAECALSFDNLLTVPKALLVARITRLSQTRLEEVCAALAIATGCD